MAPIPSPAVEALQLADETLRSLELEQLPLTNIAMRASRIARLMGDTDYEQIFKYEVAGYPTSTERIAPDIWRLLGIANRYYPQFDSNTNQTKSYAYLESIEALEALAREVQERSSPRETNSFQRLLATAVGDTGTRRVAARRGLLHDFLSSRYYQLKYSGITADAFTRIRLTVDARVAQHVPLAVQQFDSIYANLQSENPEDWANAAHSCRRILEGLADALFPVTADRQKNGRVIKLGPSHYKNRLICYADDHSQSQTFNAVVGSSLAFLQDRLDALFEAANKGTHAAITRAEADRYVVYTYLIIGDLLSL